MNVIVTDLSRGGDIARWKRSRAISAQPELGTEQLQLGKKDGQYYHVPFYPDAPSQTLRWGEPFPCDMTTVNQILASLEDGYSITIGEIVKGVTLITLSKPHEA